MARATSDSPRTFPESQEDLALKVVIAYEDAETGRHARNVCHALVEHLGRQWQFASEMWRFDVLRLPECRELAARGTAQADIIMISTHGAGDLPLDVKAWIELWLRDKRNLLALVALCDRPQDPSEPDWPIRSYLAGVAERGQVDFFAEPDNWPGKGLYQEHFALEYGADGTSDLLLPPGVVTSADRNVGRWGLNE
jgi:hypothetical protein